MALDLAAQAEDVLAKASQLKDAEKVRQAEAQFANRSSLLEEYQKRLASALGWLRLAAQLGVASEEESGTARLTRARERIISVRKAFATDRNSLLDDKTFRDLGRTLDILAETLEQSAVSSWARYSTTALPPSLAGDEELLRADPRNSPEMIDRLLLWDDRLRELAGKNLPSAAELNEFVTILDSRKALWEDVKIEEKPEVVQFIQASGGNGAQLELLTQAVREWLDERGLLESYVVRKKD